MAWRSGGLEAADETCWTTFVALNERHLKRLLCEYVRYHHQDRTHLRLEKGAPDGRIRSAASGRLLSHYMRAPRALGFVPSRVFMLYRGDNRIQTYSTKNHPVLGLA